MLDQHRDYVLRTVEERGVRLVRLWFTDVLGNLKSFAISPAELENALEDGMTFDGSSIDGFSRIQEADVLAIPDPDTFELLPWSEPGAAEARVFCDIHHLDGTPFDGDPRQVLRRHVTTATPSTSLPTSSSSTSRHRCRANVPCRSTRAGSSTSPPATRPATCARTPSASSSR